MDYVQSLSDEEIILQRKSISNLLETIKFDYNMFRSNLYVEIISKANKLLGKEDKSNVSNEFKELLKKAFDYSYKLKSSFNKYSLMDRPLFNDGEFTREESIKQIEFCYNKILHNDSEKGYFNLFDGLLNLVMNQSAIMLYRLYSITLLDDDRITQDYPYVLFGGKDKNGNIDYEFALAKYIYHLTSDIDFVEGNF